MEAEGLVEGFVVDENREEGEDVEEMSLESLIKIVHDQSKLFTCEMPKSFVV